MGDDRRRGQWGNLNSITVFSPALSVFPLASPFFRMGGKIATLSTHRCGTQSGNGNVMVLLYGNLFGNFMQILQSTGMDLHYFSQKHPSSFRFT